MVTFTTLSLLLHCRRRIGRFSVLSGLAFYVGVAATSAVAAVAPLGEAQIYKQVDGRQLELYVVKPADWRHDDRRPAIVFYHGGGWTGGTPANFNEQAAYFASRGLVCILVQYRLLEGKSDTPPLVCIQDSRTAFRWVRRHAASLGIDPARIAAAGGSAGGHLAAHLALVPDPALDDPADDRTISFRPDALLLFNPVLDNGPDNFGTRRVRDRVQEFSPAHNVKPGAPPMVMFLGSADKLIPVSVLETFRDRLRAAGGHAELHVYPGQPHGFFNFKHGDRRHFKMTLRTADKFLASLGWLQGEPTVPVLSPDGTGR